MGLLVERIPESRVSVHLGTDGQYGSTRSPGRDGGPSGNIYLTVLTSTITNHQWLERRDGRLESVRGGGSENGTGEGPDTSVGGEGGGRHSVVSVWTHRGFETGVGKGVRLTH